MLSQMCHGRMPTPENCGNTLPAYDGLPRDFRETLVKIVKLQPTPG